MKSPQLNLIALILLLVCHAAADTPPTEVRDFIQNRLEVFQGRLTAQLTNAAEIAEQMMRAYNAQHPTDIELDILSVKQLQRLVRERTNDLSPRLVLLTRTLKDDKDCNDWLTTLKEAYALCTNEAQRVTCLAISAMSPFVLGNEKFGKPMLTDLSEWLEKLSSQHPSPAIADKIRYLDLFVALGAEAYADAPVYAKGTPLRALVPLWMMSRGKWDFALREIHELRKVSDLDADEKNMLDAFESLSKGMMEKKPDK